MLLVIAHGLFGMRTRRHQVADRADRDEIDNGTVFVRAQGADPRIAAKKARQMLLR